MQKSLYQPLFLKYRPQKLSDILGQDSVKETLVNAIDNEKILLENTCDNTNPIRGSITT